MSEKETYFQVQISQGEPYPWQDVVGAICDDLETAKKGIIPEPPSHWRRRIVRVDKEVVWEMK